MIATLVFQCFLKGGDQSVVASGKTACTNYMYIVINSLSGNFVGGLEKTANIYIEAKISKSACNYFGSSIVTILTHLSDKDSWVTSF